MASGEQHDSCSRFIAVVGAVGAGIATESLTAGSGALVGGLAGLILSPDLDLVNRKGGGCVALGFWRSVGLNRYWQIYGLLPHHSMWSHWPLLGTVLRLIYSAPLISPILIGLAPFHENQQLFFIAAVLNLAIADIGHWILDGAPYAPGNHYLLRM